MTEEQQRHSWLPRRAGGQLAPAAIVDKIQAATAELAAAAVSVPAVRS